MTKKTDEFGVPEVPHERAEWDGPEGSALTKVIAEVRGIRTYRSEVYRNEDLTSLARKVGLDDPTTTFGLLKEMADTVLTDAGEKTYVETITSVPDSMAETGVPGINMGAAALLLQRDALQKKHGFLSREATAAHFVTLTDAVGLKFDLQDEETLALLTAWADAWYWLRFEETGAHGLTYTGMKALAGRQTGPAKKAKVKALASEMVRAEFAKLHPAAQRSLDAAVVEMLAPLADRLTEANLVPYKASTLRKELTALGLVRDARRAWAEAKKKH